MFPNSIRGRLQVWYGLILVIILSGFGFTACQLERGHLLGRLNSELDRRANFLANALHHHPPGPDGRDPDQGGPDQGGPEQGDAPFGRPPPGQFPDGGPPEDQDRPRQNMPLPPEAAGLFDASDPNDFYYITYSHDGEEIRRSTNAPAQPLRLPLNSPDSGREPGRNPPPSPVLVAGERAEIEKRLPLGGAIVVGCSVKPEMEALHVFAGKLTLVAGVILILGLTGGWWIAGRAIRPIEEISATATKISAGDLSQRISLAETESELGRLAAVLNSTFTRLETAFGQQKQFTSDAAHELRTPVSVILTQTQMALGKERSAPEYRQTVEACQRAAQRMRRLIESLLALARLDAGQEPMKRLDFDLGALVTDCAEMVRPLAAEKGITLQVESPAVECTGDSERIAQVVTNLLINAIQYNRPNGSVQVTTTVQNGLAVVTVRDTGVGIAAEDVPRVFERFYRSDQSRSSGGSGLGLAIAKAIIDAHGGSLELTSQTGVGSEFVIRLPSRTAA